VVALMFAGNKFHATDKQHWMPFSKNAIKRNICERFFYKTIMQLNLNLCLADSVFCCHAKLGQE